jgi:hypothetical protein
MPSKTTARTPETVEELRADLLRRLTALGYDVNAPRTKSPPTTHSPRGTSSMIDYTPHVRHQHKTIQRLKERLDNWKETLRSPAAKVIKTAEVGAGAILGGVIQGKAGPKGATIAHLPIDLLAGAALNVVAAFHVAGEENSAHLGNVGDGLIAAYLTDVGFKIGKKWNETGHLFGGHDEHGQLPAPATKASGQLSPDQLAEIVHRVQQG